MGADVFYANYLCVVWRSLQEGLCVCVGTVRAPRLYQKSTYMQHSDQHFPINNYMADYMITEETEKKKKKCIMHFHPWSNIC